MLSNVLEHYHLHQVKYNIMRRSSFMLRDMLIKQDKKPDNKSINSDSFLLKTVGYFINANIAE